MQTVTSVQNPKVKLARSLANRKGRQAAGLFLIEGTKLLQEALAWGRQPTLTMATAAWWAEHPLPDLPGERLEVPEAVLAAVATTETPDPVVALLPLESPEAALPATALVVIAHRLQDPGNLGTIIRAADAAGADAVVVTDATVDPYGPKAVRSTMGSLFHLPVLRMPLAAFRAAYPALPLYAMAGGAEASLYGCDYARGAAFLIGNEGAGLAPEDLAIADTPLSIPIFGHAESLNAAMAATICLYEAARQRGNMRACR